MAMRRSSRSAGREVPARATTCVCGRRSRPSHAWLRLRWVSGAWGRPEDSWTGHRVRTRPRHDTNCGSATTEPCLQVRSAAAGFAWPGRLQVARNRAEPSIRGAWRSRGQPPHRVEPLEGGIAGSQQEDRYGRGQRDRWRLRQEVPDEANFEWSSAGSPVRGRGLDPQTAGQIAAPVVSPRQMEKSIKR